MTRKMIHKLLACVLCCWYLLSVLGFDVHVCGHTGHVYIESLLAFVSSDDNCQAVDCDCCSEHTCCHHEGEEHEDSDCEDTVERIDLPGTQTYHVDMPTPSVAEIPVAAVVVSECVSQIAEAVSPDFFTGPPAPDITSLFCIMRV